MPPCADMGEFPLGMYLGVSLLDEKQDRVQLSRKSPTGFPRWLRSFIPTHQSQKCFISPHLCQPLIILDMLIFVTLVTVKLCLMVFICLSLTIVSLNILYVAHSHSYVKYLFICLAYFLLAYLFIYLLLLCKICSNILSSKAFSATFAANILSQLIAYHFPLFMDLWI